MLYVNVSLIVPVFNEQANISKFFDLLCRSTVMPSQIIFINAGSTDNSLSLLINLQEDFPNIDIIVKHTDRLYPGAARNLGVSLATNTIILFMDAGIDFKRDWLEHMLDEYISQKKDIIFPLCEFCGQSNFQKLICFHSNGYKAEASVVPGLITTKDIFEKTNGFSTHIIAAEDTEWRRRISKAGITSSITDRSLLRYDTFPTDYLGVFLKWQTSQYNKLIALSWSLTDSVHFILLHTLLLAPFYPESLVIYVVYRYLLVPLNRNRKIPTLNWRSRDLIAALLIPLTIDLAKFCSNWNFILNKYQRKS